MRKLLLFTFVISFLTITSCSRDEEALEVSQAEKEYLVKQMIIEFNKSAVKTGDFQRFMKSISQKNSAGSSNELDVEALFQEFLGEQSQAFLDLYYQLEALNMTGEEFKSIADQFEYLRLEMINTNSGKSSDSGCGENSTLVCAFLDWYRSGSNDEGTAEQ